MAAPTVPNDPATAPSIPDVIAARPWLRYNAMDGLLLDDVPLNAIAGAIGTPTWVYSAATMRARYKALTNAMTDAGLDIHIHYAARPTTPARCSPCSANKAPGRMSSAAANS
jgi:diaminopimelate decarboxylase